MQQSIYFKVQVKHTIVANYNGCILLNVQIGVDQNVTAKRERNNQINSKTKNCLDKMGVNYKENQTIDRKEKSNPHIFRKSIWIDT